MPEETQLTIGVEVRSSDAVCGKVSRVVVDPVALAVTHLVVDPKHPTGLGRLVPLDLVEVSAGEVRLRCTRAEFDRLDPAEETDFLPGTGRYGDYEPGQWYVWPYYGLTDGGLTMESGMGLGGGIGTGMAPYPVTHETVPPGEIDIHRGDHVLATDGEIGRVQGLVINPEDHRVTHVLLQEGHLWGRKQVTIPIAAVTSVAEGIRLSLTKKEIEDLPPVGIEPPAR